MRLRMTCYGMARMACHEERGIVPGFAGSVRVLGASETPTCSIVCHVRIAPGVTHLCRSLVVGQYDFTAHSHLTGNHRRQSAAACVHGNCCTRLYLSCAFLHRPPQTAPVAINGLNERCFAVVVVL